MIQFAPETPDDFDEVELLLDSAFAPGRAGLSSYRLREGVAPVAALCLIAREEPALGGAVAGAIRYWPVRIGAAGAPALLLGPLAVHPTRQGEGLGGALTAQSLARAAALGWARVILIGDEPYYSRMGFSRAAAAALEFPPPTNPRRLLARALAPGAMENVGGMVRRWAG